MSKHTPGPWDCYQDKSEGVFRLCTNRPLAQVPYELRTLHEDAANASLMRSAPDLLAALEALLEFEHNSTPIHPGSLVWDDARAAIEKARGEV